MRGSWLTWLVLSATRAAADNSTLHITATGDVAATDNVFAAAGDARQADVFTQLRPGVLWAYNAPRMIHELTAEVELLEYALHSDKPSVTERAAWKGFFLPGPRSEVLLSAEGSTGQLNALASRTTPDQTSVGVVPVSSQPISIRQAAATEAGSYQAGKEVRTSQTGFARFTSTDDNLMMPTKTSSFEAGGAFGLERQFRMNAVAVEAGASYLRLERLVPPGTMPGSLLERQVNPRGTLVWRHDIDRHWSSDLDGGVVYVNPIAKNPYNPAEPHKPGLFPIFGGLLAYSEMWGRATLAVRRAVTPNLLIAQNTVDDSATGQVAMPLPWLDEQPHLRTPKLVGLASIGVERTQLFDPATGTLNGRFYVGRLDAGLAWTPHPGQTWGIRYEFAYQHGDATAVLVAPSYFRNTLYVTFSLRYPDRVAAQVPRSNQSVRADRKDLAPIGAEPVVPDPTEALPDEDADHR